MVTLTKLEVGVAASSRDEAERASAEAEEEDPKVPNHPPEWLHLRFEDIPVGGRLAHFRDR